MVGTGAGMIIRRRGVGIHELDLFMEAEKNVAFVVFSAANEIPLIWCLFLEKGRIWIGYPSGTRYRVLRMGSETRINAAVRDMHKWAKHRAQREFIPEVVA